jgi:3-hydroxybutyryl-CoA dehydrogenase
VRIAILGPGRIARPIAITFALGGWMVRLVDLKPRTAAETDALFAEAWREMRRDLALMAEEGVIEPGAIEPALQRIEACSGLESVRNCRFVQEALPEQRELKRELFAKLGTYLDEDAIVASTSSTMSPSHLADTIARPERFLVAHWLNPAHVIPLVEVVPGPATAESVVAETITILEQLGKTPIRCADSPGFIGPRMQVLLMNEAVRLVEQGVASPEDVDRAIKAGIGFRYAAIGIFEFIDWGGVDILHRASHFMTQATGDDRYRTPKLVEEKIARNELGPKTGRGFFDYAGARRDEFETEKMRALLRQLRRMRERE